MHFHNNQESDAGGHWAEVEERFLAAVDVRQRPAVAELLKQPRCGGHGLRLWLRALVTQDRSLPEVIPSQLIDVYLDDPDAIPLHDCADCGLAIPVRSCPRDGYDDAPAKVLFATCPSCGGRTGLYAYWSRPSVAGWRVDGAAVTRSSSAPAVQSAPPSK